MLKTGKKILCTLLVVVLCLTSAPLQGFIELEWPKLPDINFGKWVAPKASAANTLVATGQCGENIYWSYGKETGALIIFGEGEMFDYTVDTSPFLENDDIKSVIIDDGVTSIGNYAFYNCFHLEYIEIADSVSRIGDYSFSACDNINKLQVPDSVVTIGREAFSYCGLKKINIGKKVKNIGELAFYNCPIDVITVDKYNTSFSSDEYGVLFNKDKTILIQYPAGNIRETYIVPNCVTTIGDCAFELSKLVYIEFANNLISIGNSAFSNCENIKELEIPDSVKTIGDRSFSWCENLENLKIGKNLETVGTDAFIMCSSLENIVVDKNNLNFSSDKYGVLFNKNKTIIIQYPIGNDRENYSIPDTVEIIEVRAFYWCNLKSVNIGKNVTKIAVDAFYDSSLVSVYIPNSVKEIGDGAFFCGTADVYYSGTKEQWNSINIGEENDGLFKATIHYNSSEPEQIGELKLNHSTLITRNNSSPWLEIVNYPDGVTEKDVVWSSSNERVAYIDNSIVHPIQYGKTFITVSTKDGKYSDSCELTVQSSFVITSTNSSLSGLKAGEEAEYTIMLLDHEGNKLPVENVTLSNQNSKYLEIVNHERTETEIKLTVKGLKAGTSVLEFGNDEPLTYNKFVFDIYPATVTYRADKVPVRDEELKTNFSRSGMFVENFRYYAAGEPAEYYMALMNVYNKNSSVGVVASYTQDGQLYDIAEVKKHQTLPTDYFEFLAVLGKGAVDIALLNTYNYRYSVESTKTEIEIKVPENGYITVSNDIKSSPINFVYGMMSVAVETAFQLAEDLTSIDSDKKSTIVKKLTKEVTDYFSKDTDHFDELVEELSKDVIKNSSKMNIVSMGNYSLDVVSAIFEAMKKKFDDVLNSALNEVLKDSAHTFIKMSMMKDFIDNKAIDKVTGGYIKAGEIMFSAAEHFNIVAEIIDLIHSAYSGETTVTFGKCNEDGFICKDTIKVNLKEEQEVLDAIYLQHYQIYIDKNQLTLRPEIKDLNLKENSVVEVHEITIMRDGVPYEIKQEVSVEIDIPDGWATFNFKIYRVEPDGKLTDMFARVANGKAYFTTDHFSEYIFVGELEENHIHTYTSSSVNPTCTENGYIKYTCVCNYSYTEKIPATGHSFAEGKSKCENCDYDRVDDCSCKCHKTGFITKLIWKITLFFNKLLRRNQLCDCGVYHY